jgi:hypothetical protein
MWSSIADKDARRGRILPADALLSQPTTGIAGCCERPASGHPAAADEIASSHCPSRAQDRANLGFRLRPSNQESPSSEMGFNGLFAKQQAAAHVGSGSISVDGDNKSFRFPPKAESRKDLIGSLTGIPQSLKATTVMPSPLSLKAKLAQCRT